MNLFAYSISQKRGYIKQEGGRRKVQVDVIGIIIPQGCANIYVFHKEEDFIAQIQGGKMIPLYCNEDYQKEDGLFVAYVP